MKEIKFNTIEELYERVLPALKTRAKEFKRAGYFFITVKDIWDALEKEKWSEKKDLQLCDIVDDILNCEDRIIINYCKNNIEMMPRRKDTSIL